MNINWEKGKPLPNAKAAKIDLQKFTEYSMKPDNPQNQGKWMGFAMLGYLVETTEGRRIAAQDIVRQLSKALPYATAHRGKNNAYGIRFKVKIEVEGFNARTGDLITIWQIDRDAAIPRLITNWLEVHNQRRF